MYLRKEDNEFLIYCLGRNGEPQASKNVQVYLYHKDINKVDVSYNTQTDSKGRVKLGHLRGVYKIKSIFDSKFEEIFNILGEKCDYWTQTQEHHLVSGEIFETPVNMQGELTRRNASLIMSRDRKILKNLFNRIKLVDVENSDYKIL